MRAIEAAAIASGAVTGLELMERAGTGVCAAIYAMWPALERQRYAPTPTAPFHAVILCGPGNNGGDGFVLARLLRQRGWRVTVHLYGEPGKLPPDARTNHDRWRRIGPVQSLPAQPDFGTPTLVIDALFGIGLTRPLTGFEAIFAAILRCGAPVVAVDLPSGRDAEARAETQDWPAAPCTLAVTFHAEKPIHAVLRAQGIAVVVAPLGL
ncbi:NAD(P)H-hydrate epimerase [Rhodobacter sp. TJ_12]|uniref:NAD(P)H-hydrate epimerase n=1 Tax=Rhodobacter sp. TJ_12 TaxID=2029399 RepID=UPI002958406F|nr:NAD(P)H-hydrate epimerase [Rhodobacter sp. TJ_12]